MAGRVDAVLASAWPGLTRARIQRLIAAGHVRVNGSLVRKSAVIEVGDVVRLEEVTTDAHRSTGLPGVPIPVLYEDADMVAVDKPAGVVVHDGPGEPALAVTSWFLATYPAAVAAFGADRPGIVHRLDKDTTGVLLLAKTPGAQARLSRAFEQREVAKVYLAICDGVPKRPRGVVDAPIGRHPGDRTRMAVVARGRAARTAYEVLASARGVSLIEARPETGRTHQIRAHLAAIGAPVAGDRVYGRGRGARQLLHAWRLTVPVVGGHLELTAPPPQDMREAAELCGLGQALMRYCEAGAGGLLTAAPGATKP